MRLRWFAGLLLLGTGCAQELPEPELLFELPPDAVDGTPTAGWDGWRVDSPIIRQFTTDRDGARPRQPSLQSTVVDFSAGMFALIASDGTALSLVDLDDAVETAHLVSKTGSLPPGDYDLRVKVDGFATQLHPGLTVGEHGQASDFQPTRLGGLIQSLVIRDSMPAIAASLPLHLRAIALDDTTAQVSIWAQGTADDQEPLCRAWHGKATLSPTGMVSVQHAELTAGGALPIRLTDITLSMGFNADGTEVAGVELTATTDTRPFNEFVDDDPNAPEDAICELLSRVDMQCFPCEGDANQPFCVTFEAARGFGIGQTEAELLAAVASDLVSLDDAPLCGGPDDGEDLPLEALFSCSTLGPIGMGAWFIGLGTMFLRRRRRVHADAPDRE